MRNSATIYRPGTSQSITTGASSVPTTNAVDGQTYCIRLHATADLFFTLGAAPTATTSDVFMAGGATEYFQINPGEKVAAIQSSAAGVLYVTEMTN